jgi:hypothetical protein
MNDLKAKGVWDLHMVYEFNAFLDMQDDTRVAVEQYSRDESERGGRK